MSKKMALVALAAAVALFAAICLWPAGGEEPDDMPLSPANAPNEARLGEEATLTQKLSYTRCEHSITRRVTAPVELRGATLEDVQALYPEWQVTEFSAQGAVMEQQPDLYCPDHLVVLPNGAGMLCVFQNQYGDALKLVRELSINLADLPAAVQEDIEHGLGFDTAEELEMWLESVES